MLTIISDGVCCDSLSHSERTKRLRRFVRFRQRLAQSRQDLWPLWQYAAVRRLAPPCVCRGERRRLNIQQNEHGGSRCQGGGHAARGWVRCGDRGEAASNGTFIFFYQLVVKHLNIYDIFAFLRTRAVQGGPRLPIPLSGCVQALARLCIGRRLDAAATCSAEQQHDTAEKRSSSQPEFHSAQFSAPESLTGFQQRLRQVRFSGSPKAFG